MDGERERERRFNGGASATVVDMVRIGRGGGREVGSLDWRN